MRKILYVLNGVQQLVEVGVGGGVTKDATILWDEDLHGPMPNVPDPTVCDISGSGLSTTLVENAAKVAAKAQKEADRIAKEQEKESLKSERATLRAALEAETITSAQLRRFLKLHFKLKGE